MKLTLGFSPCPNDTFIFDALVNKKIDTGGVEFDVVLEDVESLNRWAFEEKLDITKLSYPAFFQNLDKYILLNSGAALGKGVGPLLISKYKIHPGLSGPNSEIAKSTIALPGENTTAHLLFSFACPDAANKIFMRFDKIEDAVLSGEAGLGVIIHENRFTYQQKGLYKVMDLGAYWEEKMKVPIPLGGIAVKRSIGHENALLIEKLIRQSLQFAFALYPDIAEYVKQHALEMNEDVMRRHIELYVNDFSIDLTAEGRNAITILHRVFTGYLPNDLHSSGSLFLL